MKIILFVGMGKNRRFFDPKHQPEPMKESEMSCDSHIVGSLRRVQRSDGLPQNRRRVV
jgi:hypothetical protein